VPLTLACNRVSPHRTIRVTAEAAEGARTPTSAHDKLMLGVVLRRLCPDTENRTAAPVDVRDLSCTCSLFGGYRRVSAANGLLGAAPRGVGETTIRRHSISVRFSEAIRNSKSCSAGGSGTSPTRRVRSFVHATTGSGKPVSMVPLSDPTMTISYLLMACRLMRGRATRARFSHIIVVGHPVSFGGGREFAGCRISLPTGTRSGPLDAIAPDGIDEMCEPTSPDPCERAGSPARRRSSPHPWSPTEH
jgi:hypothetical protein